MVILSILICTIPRRAGMFAILLNELERQAQGYMVEILADDQPGSIGAKRQRLLQKATGDYVAFIDDDDEVSPQYVKLIIEAAEQKFDAIGFEGEITTNGRHAKRFSISMHHKYEEKGGIYYRYNNHLSPVLRDIALQIGYKDLSYGEDFDFAKRLHESGLIKTEHYIYTPMYFYKYITKKSYK